MSNHKKLLYCALAALLAWLALIIYLLLKASFFYFVSDTVHAKVIKVRIVERPDLDGYANRTIYLTLRYAVGPEEYDSSEISDQFMHYVGDMVKVRYRRGDPSDIHYQYWGRLWLISLMMAWTIGGIYMTLN
ncbi:hypothetical protein [Pseudoduganella sp. RAF53_2]|uniref:hypothetical protein n=1 Tax=unclassified Pseudoduganella TaxID=2637179 RepID=UPI003F9908E8